MERQRILELVVEFQRTQKLRRLACSRRGEWNRFWPAFQGREKRRRLSGVAEESRQVGEMVTESKRREEQSPRGEMGRVSEERGAESQRREEQSPRGERSREA